MRLPTGDTWRSVLSRGTMHVGTWWHQTTWRLGTGRRLGGWGGVEGKWAKHSWGQGGPQAKGFGLHPLGIRALIEKHALLERWSGAGKLGVDTLKHCPWNSGRDREGSVFPCHDAHPLDESKRNGQRALSGVVIALLHPTPYTSPWLQSGNPFLCHLEVLENEGDVGTVLSLSH